VELEPGTILLGKYRIDALIGTGGMGNVVRASHLFLHQPVAIKILLPSMAEDASTVQRFLREAQATVKLKSEHSARVIDVGTSPDGTPFMVMEFLDGNDLNQILRHHGPQQAAIVVDLMLQACEGIAEAHALGIIHRDIKPSNFFITRRTDGSMLLKILDFGISKTPVGYDELTGTQMVLGTPQYMAPEQMKSGRFADPRSDIWSIGVVIYQMLVGRPPFAGESYADLVLKVGLEPPEPIAIPLPTGLADVVMRCLEKDPKLRFQNVGELARHIAPFATDPISSAQTAARVARILQQRSMQIGGPNTLMQGGLSGAIPISPAQMTPGSWPASQPTSLSQGVGQVTLGTRGGRGWIIAGLAALSVVAGAGGYAISQLSHQDPSANAPAAVSEPAAPPPPAAVTPPAPATVAPIAPVPVEAPPPPIHPVPPPDKVAAPVATKPVDTRPPDMKPVDAKPAAKPAVVSAPAPAAEPKHTATKPASPVPARPASDSKPAATKPTKIKKADDLFDSRR
jgi:serine/threonine-protein kinase